MAPFPYKALDNNNHEMRVFEFWNISPRPEKPRFVGTLEHISLIDRERYDALSYCWGDSTQDHVVTISTSHKATITDYQIHITDNLQSALAALWQRSGEKMILRIWVDAICINQNDLYERSQQVQMMRQIYSKAEKVLAWVGSNPQNVLSSLHIADFNQYHKMTEEQWHAMKLFFNEEYWRRVWIIQEITVASTVVMLYGDLEFPWTKLASALKKLLQHSAQEHDESEIDGEIGASHLLKFREHWIDTNKPITLLQAMLWTLHTKATDPRDKIFALLGLCHDGFRLVPIPNYKQSLGPIISEMSKLSFSRNRSLDLMCLKGTGTKLKHSTGLPSWTPNWPNLWSGTTTLHEKEILRSLTTCNFDPVLENSTPSILRVEAVFVGSILGISTALETEDRRTKSTQLKQNPRSWIYYTENLRQELGNPTAMETERRRAIWKTLLLRVLGPVDDAIDMEECFNALWTPQGRGSIYSTRVIDWIDRNAWFEIGPWTLREWSQLCGEYSRYNRHLVDFSLKRRIRAWDTTNRALEQVLGNGLRLAEISGGLGGFAPALVNPQAEVNDKIFFLKGCKTPLIMRPAHDDNKSYELIGGIWLFSEMLGLTYHQNWSEGKGGVPDGLHVNILELV